MVCQVKRQASRNPGFVLAWFSSLASCREGDGEFLCPRLVWVITQHSVESWKTIDGYPIIKKGPLHYLLFYDLLLYYYQKKENYLFVLLYLQWNGSTPNFVLLMLFLSHQDVSLFRLLYCSYLTIRFTDTLNFILLFNGIRVGRSTSGIDQFLRQTLGHRFQVTKGRFSCSHGQ